MIVLDTNVLSELVRPAPNRRVVAWFERTRGQHATTSVNLAELAYGVERLPEGHRRQVLEQALTALIDGMGQALLSFDASAARVFAPIFAGRERAGRSLDIADAQIAAVCRLHGLPLATRNIRDFEGLGLELINPWNPA